MASDELNMTVRSDKLMQKVILRVTFLDPPAARLRRWLGIKLIILTAWVMQCGIEFQELD